MNQTQALQWLRAFHEIHPALTQSDPHLKAEAEYIGLLAAVNIDVDDEDANKLHFDAFRADHLPRADDEEKAAFKEIEEKAKQQTQIHDA